jgi:hypothetical protein
MNEERERYEKEQKEKACSAVLGGLENNFARARKIKDPMTRHIIFLEKLLTIQDVVVGTLNVYHVDMSDDLKIRIEKLMGLYNDEIDSLLDWIQSPIYDPSHPIGNAMMKACEEDFSHRK